MIRFNSINKTETYIELDAEDGGKMFMPTSQTIFVDDNSNAISVKTTGSRKTIGVVISGGTPPVPPTPTGETTYTVTLTGTMPKAENVTIRFGSNGQTVTGLGTYNYTSTADSVSVDIILAGQDLRYTYSYNPSLPLTLTSGSPSISIEIIEHSESEFKWIATYADSHTESAECGGSTTIKYNEIPDKTKVVSVEIGDCVVSIGYYVFLGCSGLTGITIPNGVIGIGTEAFENCTSLTSVTIPSAITRIGERTFKGCTGLTSATILATTPPSLPGSNAFDNTNNCPIYVPAESVDAYKAAWSHYASRIQPIT